MPDWLGERRPAEQYDERTPYIARDIGRLLDVSPMQVDFLVRGYLANMGAYAMALMDWMTGMASDRPAKEATAWFELPAIRRFVGTDIPRHTEYVDQFYKMKREADEVYRSVLGLQAQGEIARANELMGQKSRQFALRDSLDNIGEEISKINRAIMLTRASTYLTGEEKREAIDRLVLARNNLGRAGARLRPFFEGREPTELETAE